MKKLLFASLITAALLLSLAACGESTSPAASESESFPESAAPAEDTGQNPVMNLIGVYSTDYSMEALVEAEGEESAKITVTYAASPWFHDQTVMSGRFDPAALTVEFNDAALTEYTYNSDGSVDTETLSYTGGTGRAVFSLADNTLTITEEFESGDIVTVFNWGPASDMKYVTDPEHYSMVTAMDKAEIETVVGFNARTAYLSENWYAMADMIRYPITISSTELSDADAFIGFMRDKTISDGDRQAMYDEDLLDMFVNGQGICMGGGEIWLNDPNYMTDQEPQLEIIAISGIVSRDDEPAAQDGGYAAQDPYAAEEEAEFDRDFYDAPSVIVYDDSGTAHTIYESSDGYWREEDGTTYIRVSDTEFQLRDSGISLFVR